MLERLSELRKERKWSLQETADRLGIAKSTYAGYESGYRLPSLPSLSQIADLFETSLDFILGRTDENMVEITELIKKTDQKLSIDNLPLSIEDMIDFVAFVRAKRELTSK